MKARPLDHRWPAEAGETDTFNLRVEGSTVLLQLRSLVTGGNSVDLAFPLYHALFVVDEGDLSRYWGTGQFDRDHFLYEIVEGPHVARAAVAWPVSCHIRAARRARMVCPYLRRLRHSHFDIKASGQLCT